MTVTKVFLWFVILCLYGCSGSDEIQNRPEIPEPEMLRPVNVLFIGNSHTRWNQGVDQGLSDFLTSANLDYTPNIQKQTMDGASLRDHLENDATMARIQEREWDVIILQENSSVAADLPAEAVLAIQDLSFALAPKTKIYLFMTWAYEAEPSMLSDIKATYEQAASLVSGIIVPVGLAFKEVQEDSASGINLYDADGVHPSVEGTYLASAHFYAYIYGKDPRSSSFQGGLTEEHSEYLKNTAYRVWTTYPD